MKNSMSGCHSNDCCLHPLVDQSDSFSANIYIAMEAILTRGWTLPHFKISRHDFLGFRLCLLGCQHGIDEIGDGGDHMTASQVNFSTGNHIIQKWTTTYHTSSQLADPKTIVTIQLATTISSR
ncbi:hypothetical protein IAQ61_002542 [Plenodomus lingam]|uniref:uncharacterized protein n=1 Tax=Leptosphaeria maculans TaxID=5022 RepID=UPI00331EA346|nr:hypothetical protein IAQ61_002542 [Plenodomus lingam]